MITQNISTITDLRFKTKSVLDKADNSPVFLFNRSTPAGVIMSFKKYEEIMGVLEDYYLSVKAEEYEKENKANIDWVSHKDVKKAI